MTCVAWDGSLRCWLAAAPAREPGLTDFTPVVLSLLVVGLGMVILMSVRGRLSRQQAAAKSPRERIEQIKSKAGEQQEMTGVTATAYDAAGRMAAQLDGKAARLEQLLAEADERIEMLTAMLEAAGYEVAVETTSGVAAAAEEPAPTITTTPSEPMDPLTRDVFRLAREGRSAVQIAQMLDEQVGKIELILALRG